MSRVEVIGDATLYLGDCLEILPTLAPVDLVITDPPYAENTHKQAKTNGGAGHDVKMVTFEALDDEGFAAVVDACIKVADGWVVMTCDYHHAANLYDHPAWIRLGAWVKPNPMPQISADRPGQGFETVAILHAGKRPKAWSRGGGAAVWTVSPHSGAKVPTQKPLPLISAFVNDFSRPDETVCDPFMGSGTTGVACARAGRRFVGIEAKEAHFDIACRQIAAGHSNGAQPALFDVWEPQEAIG